MLKLSKTTLSLYRVISGLGRKILTVIKTLDLGMIVVICGA